MSNDKTIETNPGLEAGGNSKIQNPKSKIKRGLGRTNGANGNGATDAGGIGAIVIGGDYRGLGVVRSLGRRGIPVWVLTDDHLIAGTSRYARRRLAWPAGDESRQINCLLDLADQGLEGWMLFPTGDTTAALIARHHATLAQRFRLTTPPWDVMQWAYDKRLTHNLATKLGVDHPWTHYPSSREDVAALECEFPVILKPAIKEGHSRFMYEKAWRASNRQELLARYDEARSQVAPDVIMVQELIPGGGNTQFSYAALCLDGQTLAWSVAQRTRQHPMDFGRSSSYVETVERAEIEEPSRRLLEELGYTGIAEVEYKLDRRDGLYKLLDINPRVWGWHTLCGRAGVDFPYLLWQMVLYEESRRQKAEGSTPADNLLPTADRVLPTDGWPLPPGLHTRPGVRWIRMTTDVSAVLPEIWRGRLSPRTYLWSLRAPLEFAILAANDPLPGLAEVPLLAYTMLKRRK